jgi:hypothetical protein
MSNLAAYNLSAVINGRLFGVHVESSAIRKRLERVRASQAALWCAAWDVFLFDSLGLLPTEGLLRAGLDPDAASKVLDAVKDTDACTDADCVELLRQVRDIEKLESAIRHPLDALVTEFEQVHGQMAHIKVLCRAVGAASDRLINACSSRENPETLRSMTLSLYSP